MYCKHAEVGQAWLGKKNIALQNQARLMYYKHAEVGQA